LSNLDRVRPLFLIEANRAEAALTCTEKGMSIRNASSKVFSGFQKFLLSLGQKAS
jgi:hypothetical protein